MKKIAIFASGSGTNAENIIRYFAKGDQARVELVLCTRRVPFLAAHGLVPDRWNSGQRL